MSYEDQLIREMTTDHGLPDLEDPNEDNETGTEQRDVEAYWKSKEGKCLACGLEIAVQDQYCPKCTEFLIEVHNDKS